VKCGLFLLLPDAPAAVLLGGVQIHQIYSGSRLRNFSYVIHSREQERVYCIDPYDAGQLAEFLSERGLRLTHIINTHEHADHTCGNTGLLERFRDVRVWAHERAGPFVPGFDRGLRKGERLSIGEGVEFEVLDTPGHTFAHLCLLIRKGRAPCAVLTGDTLFNAGVGRCDRGGDVDTLYETIRDQFQALADTVQVYPGHEYMGNNLRFTLQYEAGNEMALDLMRKYEQAIAGGRYLVSTLGLERAVNTFLRLDSPELRQELGRQFADVRDNPSDRAIFRLLRHLRDTW
jgi:hydroxyacylglutathione hydrolase